MSGSWDHIRAVVRQGSGLALCLGVVLGLSSLGCRAIVGIEKRSEAIETDGTDASLDADAPTDADPPVDAGTDCDVQTDSGCPPCDAGTEVGTITCETTLAEHYYDQPDSGLPDLGPAFSGPRMERLDETWAMVWLGDEHQSVMQLAINGHDDDMRLPALLPADLGKEYVDPILAAGDDRMILGVSSTVASGDHSIDFYTYEPLTGQILDDIEYATQDPQMPLVLSGIAVAPYQNRFLAVSRQAEFPGVAGHVSLQLFQTKPLALLGEWMLLDDELQPVEAYQATVAWSQAAQRFGVVHMDTQTVTHGWLTLFDMQFIEATYELTGGLARPIADASMFEMSVTARDDDFVVAWLDRREPPATGYPENNLNVYAVAIDPATGVTSPPGGVKVSDAMARRRHVKVVNDGTSVLVAWAEEDTLYDTIRMRRLDADLKPFGGIVDIGEGDEVFQGPFGAVVAGQGDYGFASLASGSDLYFNRISCIGP